MSATLDRMFAAKDLRSYPLIAMHAVIATRLSFLFVRAGRDPLPDLAVRLRSMRAAKAHQALLGTIAECWGDVFAIHRPCCMQVGPDEMLLAELASAALRSDHRAAADAMRDQLPAQARNRLWHGMIELVDAIRSAQVEPVDSPRDP